MWITHSRTHVVNGVTVRLERSYRVPTRLLLALALLGALVAAAFLTTAVARADNSGPVLRCTVTQDASGNVYLDDCDVYTDSDGTR
jgi:hypothetical protein